MFKILQYFQSKASNLFIKHSKLQHIPIPLSIQYAETTKFVLIFKSVQKSAIFRIFSKSKTRNFLKI